MASNQNIIVGLDIGTSSILVVVAEVLQEQRVNVIGIGSSPSRGLRKGVVINIEGTVESISKAVSQAETMAGCHISSVYVSISGSHIKSFNSNGVVRIKNKEVSAADVEKVIEAAKAVAIPMDREVLHVLPQEFIIDEQDGIKDPLGISGVRLEAKVHIVTGAVASAENIVKCSNQCGLSVQDIVISAFAAGRAVLWPEEQELGVCLLDIGGGTSDLIVFQGGAVKCTSVLPLGGNHITSDIATGLRTPTVAAEDIKKKFGSAMVSLVKNDDTIEVPSTGDRNPRVISKVPLAEIIEPRVTELFNLAHKELARLGYLDLLTSGVVITGGSAGLSGIDKVAEHVFNLPVRIGHPRGVTGLIDLVSSPEWASAVGLVLYGASLRQSNARHAGQQKGVGKVFKRVANWFSEHF